MQKPKLLVISSVWVEPKSSAAGSRMLQLIVFFQSIGYEVIYSSTALDSEYALDLKMFEIQTHAVQLNDSSFDVFVSELQPDVVLFDRFMVEEQFGWRMDINCPQALKILDTEDLHCLRHARREAYKKNICFSEELLFSEIAKREIASIFRCDLALIISEYELELLKDFFKVNEELLFYLPLLVDDSLMNNSAELSFEEKKDFVFIGNFLHEPNWNCVQVLKNEIWPELSKKIPDAVMLIYGAYPSQKVFQLNNPKERFLIKGRAENSQKVIEQARVLLAPIRFGAGIKGKLLEAMIYGTPSITTTIGAEAMAGKLTWSGIIADDNNKFIDAALELYTNKTAWTATQENGFKIICERFSSSDFLNDLKLKIDFLLNNLNKHRFQNFIGAMLQHHTMQSTRYMSKWIEEKNKK
ncbi:glycosyltransferase family 4 protein [Flavobacterium sp. SM15]|uniref:glycosyltransferase n=1 Tax=Flavobacterium sp. SM15 TaxID=2908005 RepID=UPI001EDA8FA2|nr:glycosyltransferase [Flavobacterium sp. SM15]MCG2612554.1 glycosyltransferase family 4 protein [Flavobacterium sp. SM15]